MDQDRNIRVNWGTFNIPTIVGMFAVFGAVYSLGGELSRDNQRITTIEDSRVVMGAQYQAQMIAIQTDLKQVQAEVPTLTYRVTVAEQGLVAANQRMDRFADVVGDLRSDIAKTTTAIEVLSQKLDVVFPGKPNGK